MILIPNECRIDRLDADSANALVGGLLPISWTGLSERFPAMVYLERGAVADEEVEVH